MTELYQARLLVEPEIAARAAQRFTEEDAAEARACLERASAARARGDTVGAARADAAFHRVLHRAARSPWLAHLATESFDAAQRYRSGPAAPDPERGREARRERERILAACVARDARGAAVALHDHLAATANRIAAEQRASPPFQLRKDRSLTEPTSFAPSEQALARVRPGVDGATVETGDLTVTTYRYRAGAVWEEHAHPEDQVTLHLSGGELNFTVGGRDVALRPGELLLIPGGTPHSAVAGDTDVLTLNVWRLRSKPPS